MQIDIRGFHVAADFSRLATCLVRQIIRVYFITASPLSAFLCDFPCITKLLLPLPSTIELLSRAQFEGTRGRRRFCLARFYFTLFLHYFHVSPRDWHWLLWDHWRLLFNFFSAPPRGLSQNRFSSCYMRHQLVWEDLRSRKMSTLKL